MGEVRNQAKRADMLSPILPQVGIKTAKLAGLCHLEPIFRELRHSTARLQVQCVLIWMLTHAHVSHLNPTQA